MPTEFSQAASHPPQAARGRETLPRVSEPKTDHIRFCFGIPNRPETPALSEGRTAGQSRRRDATPRQNNNKSLADSQPPLIPSATSGSTKRRRLERTEANPLLQPPGEVRRGYVGAPSSGQPRGGAAKQRRLSIKEPVLTDGRP